MKYNCIKIKVCGMKFIKNIENISKLKPDFMGFLFYKLSPRFVGKNFFIPNLNNIKKVGVFVNPSQEEIKKKIKKYNLDYIQLHGEQTSKFCKNLIDKNVKIIKVFNIDKNFSFEETKNYLDSSSYFLFDTKSKQYGGSGKKFSWKKLLEYSFNIPFFLSGGITLKDAEIIRSISHPNLFGVDINSGFENKLALKSFSKIRKFIKKLNL